MTRSIITPHSQTHSKWENWTFSLAKLGLDVEVFYRTVSNHILVAKEVPVTRRVSVGLRGSLPPWIRSCELAYYVALTSSQHSFSKWPEIRSTRINNHQVRHRSANNQSLKGRKEYTNYIQRSEKQEVKMSHSSSVTGRASGERKNFVVQHFNLE